MGKKKQHGGAREGAGRKPGPEGPTATLTVTVPEALLERMDAYRGAQGWTRSKAVTEGIRGLLRRKKSRK